MQVPAQVASMLASVQIMYFAILMHQIGTCGNAVMHVVLIVILLSDLLILCLTITSSEHHSVFKYGCFNS